MKHNKYLFLRLVTLFALLPNFLLGQEKDTIAKILSSNNNDTTKIESILDYAQELAWTDVTKAEEYTRQALKMAEKNSLQKKHCLRQIQAFTHL